MRTVVTDFRTDVEIAGVRIRPGDLVLGDVDGVLIVPAEVEEEAVEMAFEKVSKENLVLKAVRAGMSTTEAFDKYGVL